MCSSLQFVFIFATWMCVSQTHATLCIFSNPFSLFFNILVKSCSRKALCWFLTEGKRNGEQ